MAAPSSLNPTPQQAKALQDAMATKIVPKEESLGALHPNLAAEWNWEKNSPKTPFEVRPKSNLRVWWRCESDHEWESQIYNRHVRGCPHCFDLARRVNAKLTLKELPDLFDEVFADEVEKIALGEITQSSHQKLLWKCKACDQIFGNQIQNRAIKKQGCPYCKQLKVAPNGWNSLGVLFPEVAAEWDNEKNSGVTPFQVTPKSNKSFWWRCANGHSWEAVVANRHKAGCPACYSLAHHIHTGTKLAEMTDLFAELSDDEQDKVKLGQLSKGDRTKVKWKCKTCKEIWENQIGKRAVNGQGCPYCAGKKVAPNGWNSLAQLHPDLIREWNYNLNKLDPQKITPGSHSRVHWKCRRGHQWNTVVAQRASQGTGCPLCSPQISKPQKRLYAELKVVFGEEVALSERIDKMEVDLYVPKYKIGIEYDGEYFHRSERKASLDSQKEIRLKALGISIFRIRAVGLADLPGSNSVLESEDDSPETIKSLIRLIMSKIELEPADALRLDDYLKHSDYVNDEYYRELVLEHNKPILQKSLAHLNPELVKEWSDRNSDTPEDVTPGFDGKRWWKCQTCSREWQAQVYSRARLGTGCRFCFGNFANDERNLALAFPSIASEWHPHKNGTLTPYEVAPKGLAKVWWQCSEGHEWEMTVGNRTTKGQKCPYCQNKRPHALHNLLVKHPGVAALLDWELTGKDATQLTPNSGHIAFWKCPRGHVWEKKVDHQVRYGPRCKQCAELPHS